jgi:GTPase SAR1 family protein
MKSPTSNLLMVGLRGSGKTTFLAALWHYLESAEINDRMKLPQLQPDRDYLNSIRNSWLSLKPVGRTSLRLTGTVSMTVTDSQTDKQTTITLPDLSGELYGTQWSTRKAPRSYVEFAQNCAGLFLFLHAGDVKKTHTIKAKVAAEPRESTEEDGSSIPASLNWTPAQSSTQVQLVDILQLLLGLRETEATLRIAVIISAWDLVKAPVAPIAWLDRRLPLLSQFLKSNQNWLPSDVFGVSSQGGDLNKDRQKLLNSLAASSRCRAVRGTAEEVSITAPLQFLLQ